MELIADILLISGAVAAAIYCVVLSRRLRRFTDLEKGVGGAIAMLSVQVDDMTKTLEVARVSAAGSAQSLDHLTGKAEGVARRLELLVASMHDLPTPAGNEGEHEIGPSADIEPEGVSAPPPAPPEPRQEPEQGPLFLSHRRQVREAAE
jgi:hypothetical protein